MEILGWVANLLFGLGGFFKNPRVTMSHYILADVLYIIMYLSAGLWIAAFSMFVTGLRATLSLFLNEQQNITSIVVLTFIASIVVIININHPVDVLILLAGICIAMSCYFRDSIIPFRLSTSLSQVFWIIHSVTFEVYPMIFCCCIMLATNLYAVVVYTDIFKKSVNEAPSLEVV